MNWTTDDVVKQLGLCTAVVKTHTLEIENMWCVKIEEWIDRLLGDHMYHITAGKDSYSLPLDTPLDEVKKESEKALIVYLQKRIKEIEKEIKIKENGIATLKRIQQQVK